MSPAESPGVREYVDEATLDGDEEVGEMRNN